MDGEVFPTRVMVSVHPAPVTIILLYDGFQLIWVLHLFTTFVTRNWKTWNSQRLRLVKNMNATFSKCKVAKSEVCGADTLSVLAVDDTELGWNEIKSYIAPLRVKRNCLSSGKYGFTLTSSPEALGGWNQKPGQILELNVVTINIHWTSMPNILSQLTSMYI